MNEAVKEFVLQLQDIVRKQTKGKYPNVNEALRSLQSYVQKTTSTKKGVEDKLKELEDILYQEGEKKKQCTDQIGKIRVTMRRQKVEMSQRFAKHLNDISNLSSNVTSENVAKAFVMEEKTKDKYSKVLKLCETYIQECIQLCWLMQVQTPPLRLDVKTTHGQSFDKDCYKEYRRRGKVIAFVVWLALFLHENGQLLSKGVAQGQ